MAFEKAGRVSLSFFILAVRAPRALPAGLLFGDGNSSTLQSLAPAPHIPRHPRVIRPGLGLAKVKYLGPRSTCVAGIKPVETKKRGGIVRILCFATQSFAPANSPLCHPIRPQIFVYPRDAPTFAIIWPPLGYVQFRGRGSPVTAKSAILRYCCVRQETQRYRVE